MPQSQPHLQNYKGLAWVAAMALFMQSLDATILNTALPSIAADLHEPAFEMQMAIIAYSLSVALFIPLTAWAATIRHADCFPQCSGDFCIGLHWLCNCS